MRASRLVQLLLLLQARGRTTAAVLATELEVSERTIHRDVDALSAAGVPIYAERGPHGGIQLVDGYRTRLTGLTADEAEALFLSGMPGPAAELGLGTVVAAARLKVLASLPGELRARASRLVERFHLDATAWFSSSDPVPHLATLADAVWEARRASVRYRRGDEAVERQLEPIGLVLKAGVWYLIARSEERIRTYRVSRITEVTVSDATFVRPPDFDLPAYWAESTSTYEQGAPRVTFVMRVDPAVLGVLADAIGMQAVRDAERLAVDDPEGWLHLRVTADWPEEVPGRLIGMGSRAEILDPPELRERSITLARRMLGRAPRGDRAAAPRSRRDPRRAPDRRPGRTARPTRGGRRRRGASPRRARLPMPRGRRRGSPPRPTIRRRARPRPGSASRAGPQEPAPDPDHPASHHRPPHVLRRPPGTRGCRPAGRRRDRSRGACPRDRRPGPD